jgi:succinate dehydrogenase / fumarate reductase, membrane anchor subunit
MSSNVTNFSRNGVSDWLVQRATAIILGLYFICMMVFFICNGDLDYRTWKIFMSSTEMKVFTIVVLLSIVAHGWIGMWTISTDYLTKDSHVFGSVPTFVRLAFQTFCVLFLLASALWGTLLIWGF